MLGVIRPIRGCNGQFSILPGPFETFKQLVLNENYDFVALPETVLATTGNKEAVAIPHYSLVENRKNSGDGVVIYIKDSLKYKVVDLTSETSDGNVTFETLLEKLKSSAGEGSIITLIKHCTIFHNNSQTFH